MRISAELLFFIAMLSGCAPTAMTQNASDEMQVDISDGRMIAAEQCASCHAMGFDDVSPRADAPPLRALFAHYDPNALDQDFQNGMKVGHPDMPVFLIGPRGTEALIAYLRSIQTPQR